MGIGGLAQGKPWKKPKGKIVPAFPFHFKENNRGDASIRLTTVYGEFGPDVLNSIIFLIRIK